MTTTPTLESRLGRYELNAYVALDTIDEIKRRVRNLLTDRDFTVVRRYVNDTDNPRYFPDVQTGVTLDPNAYDGGFNGHSNEEQPHCGFAVYGTQGVRFGMSGGYATEKETAAAFNDGSYRYGSNYIVRVKIIGGTVRGEISQASVIQILRTNEAGVQEQIVVKPRYVLPEEAVLAEATVLDRIAVHLDTPAGPDVLTIEDAQRLAKHARENWESGLVSKDV
jgi:hypothetical protein